MTNTSTDGKVTRRRRRIIAKPLTTHTESNPSRSHPTTPDGTAIITPRDSTPPVKSYDTRGLLQAHHDPILVSEVSDAQLWSSLRPEVDTDYTIVERFTPWEIVFDLSTFQGGDAILLSTHLLFAGPNQGQARWVLSERHEVRIQVDRDATRLNIDNVPQPQGRVLAISPLTGPWPARLVYRHVGGFAQTVRYLLTR